MSAEPTRRLFTVKEYYRMGKAGILNENDRVELIEGEIIQMPPIGDRHSWCVTRAVHLLLPWEADGAIVISQNPVRLNDLSEPVPDVAVVRSRPTMSGPHPVPADVLLIVEVSDSTLRYDRGTKVPLYGRNGVPETWIVDIQGDIIYRYRGPTATGYRVVEDKRRGDRIAPEIFPQLELSVDEILGPKG
jgi:Uma2 family endonuclease